MAKFNQVVISYSAFVLLDLDSEKLRVIADVAENVEIHVVATDCYYADRPLVKISEQLEASDLNIGSAYFLGFDMKNDDTLEELGVRVRETDLCYSLYGGDIQLRILENNNLPNVATYDEISAYFALDDDGFDIFEKQPVLFIGSSELFREYFDNCQSFEKNQYIELEYLSI